MYALLLGVSILPIIILLVFVYRKDKYEKEPITMFLKALFFGILSTIPALLLEQTISRFNVFGELGMPVADGLFDGFCVAGFSEELCKLALLWLCVWKSRHFNEYFDGVVYAACIALGFAGIENVGYIFGEGDFAASLHTGIMRAILSVPAHFLFGVTMGYYFALAKFEPHHRWGNLFLALLVPMLLHGVYDSLLMIPEKMGEGSGGIVTIALFGAFIWFDIRLWKIGYKRLTAMQEKSGRQMGDDESQKDANPFNHSHYNPYQQNNNENSDKKDPFQDIDWDI
ncbi:MAG: PrsW family intramembrane metalloprotease [Bacteroidales bacterium]|nr:PrsW family intramembrane metalloprotease [Bacteroidales bacterium]